MDSQGHDALKKCGEVIHVAAYFVLLADVIYACFIRDEPRSLLLSLEYIAWSSTPVWFVIAALLIGATLDRRQGTGLLLNSFSFLIALALLVFRFLGSGFDY